jgi:hypothetical protein
MVVAEATDQFCSIVCRSGSGVAAEVSCPTVKRRTCGYLSAAASSAVAFVVAGSENCMLDCGARAAVSTPVRHGQRFESPGACPPHTNTSPTSTSLRDAVSPELDENVSEYAVFDAAVAGSFCRHVPLTSAVAMRVLLLKVVVTVAPAAVTPQTTACCGARWSTM